MSALQLAKIGDLVRRSGLCLGLLVLGLAEHSCAPDQEPLIVLGMPVLDEFCEGSAGSDQFIGGMRLDLSFDTGLTIPLEIHNQIIPMSAESTNAGIDHSEVQIDSVDVSLASPQDPAIVAQLEAAHPNHVKFNLPLPSDSLGGGAGKIVFVRVPQHTLARLSEVMLALGYSDGSEVLIDFEFRFFFKRAGTSYGKVGLVETRPFTVPVSTGFNNLRTCKPTIFTIEDRGPDSITADLCTEDQCLTSRRIGRGGSCQNSQVAETYPLCCMGSEEFQSAGRSHTECESP